MLTALFIILICSTIIQWVALIVDAVMHDESDTILGTKRAMLFLIIPGGGIVFVIGKLVEKFWYAPWK